ncbi:MAG: TIGR01777 family oxidoreductase [Pasteurellaceae bacterium]|nr:TIGR01777 family oxidoreductase [Pasteurellaceae bacterium]
MNIFITGGTGFIGKALCSALTADGHQLTLLTRQHHLLLQGGKKVDDFTKLDDFDAVINLAGEPIFDKAWSKAQKHRLKTSRLDLTTKLVQLIHQSSTPPSVLISGSATGYYGNLPTQQPADETAPCGTQFPAELCHAWEQAALTAQSEQTRVCVIRTGMVLHPSGGALKKMLPLYRIGLGGKMGEGEQHWAWISLHDQVQAIRFLLTNPNCQGAYNLVAPTPAPQYAFNHWLAQQVHRPAFCHIPSGLIRCLLGERSQLLLDNQPLVPKRLLDAGFHFSHHSLNHYALAL